MLSHRLSSKRPNVWRGDLVRSHWFESAYSLQRDEVLPLIARLGFDAQELSLEDPAFDEIIDNAKIHAAFGRRQSGQEQPDETKSPEVIVGWVTTKFQSPPWPEADQDKPDEEPISNQIGPPKPVVEPTFRPLASWSQLRTRLQPLLNRSVVTGRVDEKKLVRRLCRCESISKLPRIVRKKSPEHLHLIADRSERCIPYFADQALVSSQLALELAQDKCSYFIGEFPQTLSKSDESLYRLDCFSDDTPLEPVSGSSILILGDLGFLERKYPSEMQSWVRACRTWKQQGVSIYALLPYSVEQLPREIRHLVEPIAWQGNRIDYVMDDQRQNLIERIFTACYPAMRLEPSLLREIRSMIPDASDASLESDIWQHRYLQSNHVDGARNDRADIRALLGSGFEQLDKETRRRILEVQRQYRMASGFKTFWQLEFSNLSPKTQRLLKEYRADHEAMVWTVREYARIVSSRNIPDEMNDQIVWYAKRVSEEALANKKVGRSVRMLRNVYQRERPAHKTSRLRELASDSRSRNAIFGTKGRSLILENVLVGSGTAGSLAGEHVSLRSTSRLVEVHVPRAELLKETAVSPEVAFWKSGKKPDWVSAFGRDDYGLWCEFQVPRHDGQGVVIQRMRWINPGTFMMGSPEGEEERYEDESPWHRVTLTKGFWMADTQVTQELWIAVSGRKNPSHFEGGTNPVERVSWEDCEKWISKLCEHHASLKISLPSEAQWEYVCRAGSTAAYCFGDDPQELLKYSWFEENSKSKSYPVKQLLPNGWGLYDMHGNVWEWCRDWYGAYEKSTQLDPTGPAKGTSRVIRGGSWVSPARVPRSACRGGYRSGYRGYYLGFRIAGSALEAEPSERAMLPEADPGTERGSSAQVRVRDTEPVGDSSEIGFWKSRKKPEWVSDFGRDDYGLWCEFQVPRHDGKGVVTQRMRWIKPGTFVMGSDASTKKLWIGDETEHEVTLTQGFWMADAPCTQGLWMGVGTRENRSRFQGFSNPVERVSWEYCQAWLKSLGKVHPLMQPTLPTEAQWEYACRAGSTSAYCYGDSEEELEMYAWYEKNGGGKTHPVGAKLPNAWGLYDVHGNVWEWCHDRFKNFTKSSVTNPIGPSKGSARVVRGGSYGNSARALRSACRFGNHLGYQYDYLGFRIASSALGAEPSERAMEPEAEPGTERARIGSAELDYGFLRSIDLDATGETTAEDQFTEIEVNAYTSIRVVSDQEGYQFDRLEKPNWAVEFGHDSYGLYSVFEVEPEKGQPVRQRLRWIPPGKFVMGSAKGRDYGRGDEGPEHEVIITQGNWLFDTPCTQGLWMALMGKNPSYFPDPERPVERVGWEDAVGFAQRLNEWFEKRNSKSRGKKVLGWNELSFRLPTEAEWEYACRAGTQTETYLGDLEILGDANAPLLDRIGWYGGNSGQEYDLEQSDSLEQEWLADRQYPDKVGGTRKVSKKEPNGWGLYDMFGNVWEWCEDWYGEYSAERITDPTGSSEGALRVFRGGGFGSPARYLRSACRFRDAPGYRSFTLGFRLLSSARPPKSTESKAGLRLEGGGERRVR